MRLLEGRVEPSIVSEPAAKIASPVVASDPISSRTTQAVVEPIAIRDSVTAGAEVVLGISRYPQTDPQFLDKLCW